MLFMVIEHFRNGDPAPVYRRFAAKGRMAPEGLVYVSSWVTDDLTRCFQVMECDDRALLEKWMEQWKDLVRFEVVPVVTSAQAAASVNDHRVVDFARVDEAAAFIAALARYVASPQGEPFQKEGERIEVSALLDLVTARVAVFVSASAWRAATAAFKSLPPSTTRARAELPADRMRLIDGRSVKPMGFEEVRRRLTNPT
jgi:hypothetical protein